jgi:hypothetical protein
MPSLRNEYNKTTAGKTGSTLELFLENSINYYYRNRYQSICLKRRGLTNATQIIDFEDDFSVLKRLVLVNNEDIPIATNKQGSFGVNSSKNKILS